MNTVLTIIVVIQVISALTIIGLVLMQHGKGADMGAAFGSGASGSLFGATGSSNFLSKSTGVAAAIFFCATLALAFFGTSRSVSTGSVTDTMTSAPAAAVPATTVPATAPANAAAPATPAAPTAPATGAAAGQSGQIPK
ncbi:preprotein translocase subunit SecG [Actimicrobium antarcticum]|uniref:preprotein translocase subunit SecG n=1 Tax=Actimicrobium antarcticum TaxID=1051899 RepID=UPI0031DC7AE9